MRVNEGLTIMSGFVVTPLFCVSRSDNQPVLICHYRNLNIQLFTQLNIRIFEYPVAANMKIITLSSYKGGVGKTTSSVCLASLFSQHGQTLLIDSDPNRSASTWARSGKLPFKVCSENTATKLMGQNKFDFVIIDTPARPIESELQELAEGCDLLLLPTTPDSLSMVARCACAHPTKVSPVIGVTTKPPA